MALFISLDTLIRKTRPAQAPQLTGPLRMVKIFYQDAIDSKRLGETVAKMSEPPEITVLEFNGTLFAAMRSPHELVAAEQLHMSVRLRRVESTSDLHDTELAHFLTSAWFPRDIGSTLCSAEVETTDQTTLTLQGLNQSSTDGVFEPPDNNTED